MANNCNTKLYYPEQFDIIDDLLTFHPETVEDYINSTYEPKTASKILDAIKRGEFDENWGVIKAPIIENPKDGKQLENDTIFSKPNTSQSVRSYFEGNQTGGDIAYNRLLKDFKNKVISLLIFDKDSQEGVRDPSSQTSSGLSLINDRLYNYKMDLARELSEFLGLDTSWIGNIGLSDQEFTKKLWTVIGQLELAKNTNKANWNTHYGTYVLLKNFDRLIKEQLDFVQIKKGFDEDLKSIDMYDYVGGIAPQDISWGTEEAADISEYTSPLIKLLLDYLPEVEADGKTDSPNSITFTGFNRVMTKMIDYINNGENVRSDYKEELDKGINADWDKLIDFYINVLTGIDPNHQKVNVKYKTILVGKLRGIKKYILGSKSKLPDNIKKVFLAQVNKTVDTQYIVYRKQYNSNSKQYEIFAQNLHDDFINVQSISLQNSVKAALYRFYHNPKLFSDLLEKYGIEVKDDEIVIHHDYINNKPVQRKLFKSTKNISVTPITNKYDFNLNKKQNFSDDDENSSNAVQLIEDLLQINLPEDYASYIPIIAQNTSIFSIFSKPIAFALYAGNDTSKKKFEYEYQDEVIKTWRYKNDFSDAARYLSYIYGSDVLNVLRNSKGNNLPLYQLGSYVYDFKKLLREFNQQYQSNTGELVKAINVFANNPLVNNSNAVKRVYIRSEFNIGNKQKEARELTFSEVMQLALVDDYYNNLYIDNGNFLLQPIVYSDKRTHYLVEFDASKLLLGSGKNLRWALRELGEKFGDKLTEQSIINYVAEYRKDKTKAQIINLIRRFNNALGWNLEITKNSSWNEVTNALDSILNEIKKNYPTVKQLRALFQNTQLYEEFDIKTDKLGNITGFNETLLHNGEMYWNYNPRNESTTKLFNDRIERERFQFAKDLWNSDFSLTALRDNKLQRIFNKLKDKSPETFNKWYDSYSKTMQLFKIYNKETGTEETHFNDSMFDYTKYRLELNPILNSYYYAELTLAPAYSEILFGDVAGYPSKYKREDGISDEEYFLFSEANRLTAQCKRTMAGGSTRHSYLPNTRYGVASKVKIAEIDDPTGEIFNPLGKDKKLDLHDGGGWINPIYAIMENESLVDAAVAEDKKTIWTFTDKETGVLTEIKWAAYSLNNTRRRFSQSPADYPAEILFRKMNSIPIDDSLAKTIDFNKFYDPVNRSNSTYDRKFQDYIYYWDKLNDITWRIDYVDNQNGVAVIHETAVDKYGYEVGQTRVRNQKIIDLYSIDQVFGEAYAQTLNKELKVLEWSNWNIRILANMVGIYPKLKDNLIGYVVNHSAIKVGSRQINSLDTIKDTSVPLKTFEMSTKFGGVQMDASHDVESGHVSEMSQMISSLIQAGFSTELVDQIYRDIGEVAKAGIEKFGVAIDSGNKEEIYKILGKALIDSFNSTKRTGLGLTESFITIAENEFRKNNFNIKIPFSSPDVKSAFVTTVMSELNKLGIRRKYDGLAAVLTPSAGMIMYYTLPGVKGTLTYQEFVKSLYDGKNVLGQKALAIRQEYIDIAVANGMTEDDGKLQFLKDIFNKTILLGKYLNPTLVEPQSKSELDFYDTVIYKKLDEDWSQAKVMRLDAISKYDYVKSHLDPSQYNFAIWTAKPKDLKFGYTKFTGIVGDQTFAFNDYDTDIVRSNFYLKDLKQYISNLINNKPDNTAITKVGLDLNIIKMSLLGVDALPKNSINLIFNYIENHSNINAQDPEQFNPQYAAFVEGTLNNLIKLAEKRTQELYTALSDIQHGRSTNLKITINGVALDTVTDIEVQSGQIMLGKANASKLGLRKNDTIADVRAAGYRFFRDRIFEETGIPTNVDESLFDAVGFTSDNKKVLISIGSFNENINRINKTFSSEDFREINGDIYYKDEELCKSQGMIFREYTANDGQKYYFINIDSYDRLKQLNRTEWFNTIRLNYNTHNWKKLLIAQNPDVFDRTGKVKPGESLELNLPDTLDINGQLTLTPGGKYLIDKDLNGLDSSLLVNILRENEDDRYFSYVENLAKRKYQSFLNQLNYIAARIPTQSMQSFMPLEVVAFTDSKTNDVYVPRSLTWLEGADYWPNTVNIVVRIINFVNCEKIN